MASSRFLSMKWQLLNVSLLIGAGWLDVASISVNRSIMTTGVYKFPYPVTLAFFQILITLPVVIAASSLVQLLLRLLKSPKLAKLIDLGEKQPLYPGDDAEPASPDFSPQRTNHDRDGTPRLGWNAIKEVFPLATVYLMKVVCDNLVLARTQHPAYLLLRVEAIPLSLVLSTVINRIPHSGLTIWSTILACSSLLLAIHPSLQQITEEIVLLGLPASFLTALFPVLLLNKFHSVYDSLRPQHYARELDSESKPAHPIFHRDGLLVFWSVLRLIAVISLVEIAIVLLLSGELQDIHSNCYVLGLKFIWLLMASTGAISGVLLILTLWLVRTASPATTLFLLVPSSGHQVLITNHFRPPIHVWVDIVMCWGSSLYFFLIKAKESMSKAMNSKQKLSNILYHLIFPVVLYMGILYVARVSQAGRAGVSVEHGNATHNQDVDWYNSTESAFKPTDDYLGPRPHVDMVANLTMMVDKCKEVKNGRGVDDVVRCLSYLANSEQEYLSLPVSNQNMRASEQDPRKAQYLDADRHGNTRSRYIPPSRAQAASRLSIGTCAGPVIPFHVYWTGPATWRVELYIKAYLYTQNLPCSRLWLWLDADVDPDAVEKMLHQDRIFERFRPLVERGDITVKAWKYPNRVPIPTMKEEEESESNDFDQEEKLISKGIVQDADGQKWLVFDSSNLALSPVVVSDAVRFVVLHQYGGLYTDMDVLLRRDMRPMIVPDPATGERAFAEQWVERCEPGDFNTAVISLPANSSLSTYLLNGGLRMGLNFHPRVLGRMLFQDGRGDELAMQQNAVFDPLVTNRRREGTSKCTVPCHKNFESVFLRQVEEAQNEWSNFHGNRSDVPSAARSDIEAWAHPTNRSMENFFRGSWAYHIHNQWSTIPQPLSWMDIITAAQDDFFAGRRTNVYGETWAGPLIDTFDFKK